MGGRGSAYYEKQNQEKEQDYIKHLINESRKKQPYPYDPETERVDNYYFKLLKNNKISVRESTDKFELEELRPYQRQLQLLNEKYSVKALTDENEIQFSSYKLRGAYGALQARIDEQNKIVVRLTLDPETIKDKQNYILNKKFSISLNKSAYVDSKNVYLYTVTHEYGHLIEENIIRQRYKKRAEHLGIEYERFREIEAERIKNEVIKNLQNRYTTPVNNDMIYVSNYAKDKQKFKEGSGNDFEWFAETFTNSQLSTNSAPIAEELEKYIRRNINE